jgi:hypothetical protein
MTSALTPRGVDNNAHPRRRSATPRAGTRLALTLVLRVPVLLEQQRARTREPVAPDGRTLRLLTDDNGNPVPPTRLCTLWVELADEPEWKSGAGPGPACAGPGPIRVRGQVKTAARPPGLSQ